MKDGPGFAYPKVMRTEAECAAITAAVVKAFPKYKADIGSRRFYLDPEGGYADAPALHFYDPTARCHGSFWSFPVSSCLRDAYERHCEQVAAIFVRALFELGKGYMVGALIANHGLDLERIADLMVKAGTS